MVFKLRMSYHVIGEKMFAGFLTAAYPVGTEVFRGNVVSG